MLAKKKRGEITMKNFREILAVIIAICGLALIAVAIFKAESSYIWAEKFWALIMSGTVIFAAAFPVAGDRPFQKIDETIGIRTINKFIRRRNK